MAPSLPSQTSPEPATSITTRPVTPSPAGFTRGRKLAAFVSRWVGSIHLALVLLPLFAAVLFLGTVMESWYDNKVAQTLVYQAWWFTALLALLWLNIFFAAAKKWPWKKYQTGFLITHLGLLTLVAGGIVSSLGGTSALLLLVDSEDPRFRSYGLHTSNFMVDRNVEMLRVERPDRHAGEIMSAAFEPGPLAWQSDEYLTPHVDPVASLLGHLAAPLPRRWSRTLGDDGAALEVLAYYPHARREDFGPAESSSGFPAVKLQLISPRTGPLPPRWLAYHGQSRTLHMGSGLLEFLAEGCRPEQLAEFRKPVSAPGEKGCLVIGLGEHTLRLDIQSCVNGEAHSLGSTGWNVKILRYMAAAGRPGETVPSDPVVTVSLSRAEGSLAFVVPAHQPGEIISPGDAAPVSSIIPDLWVWYHAPDPRYGADQVHAVLQFATDAKGKLYSRTYSNSSNKGSGVSFEKAEPAQADNVSRRIWESNDWKLRISDFLPHASQGPHIIPVDRRLGLEDDDMPPALRCRLSKGREKTEFWLGKSEVGATTVYVGSERFHIGYNPYLHVLDFDLTLLRAEQTTDRGSSLPSNRTSFVLLNDPGKKIEQEPRVITMNQPLEHRGYKVYQGDYMPLGNDNNARPVSRARYLVSRDPGLWLKYAGSIMVAVGIACMFYMRAYFFKARSQTGGA